MHPKDFPFEAGRLLREKRLERGISQLQLADHAGVHASLVQRAENGRDARLSTWHNLFGALGHGLRLTLEEPDDEYASFIVEEGERRRARREEGLCTGKRRY